MPSFASVIVPSHNRPAALQTTVLHLLESLSSSPGELIVVDDGSAPPLQLPVREGLRVVRSAGVERSAARNMGACSAKGDLLVFVDDDITVPTDFVWQHLRASKEFHNALCVGRISLPPEVSRTPFGRFRRTIEEPGQNRPRGFVAEANFCTAANMSIPKTTFLSLGGFDPAILSGEDQDLALRFTACGGRIVYLPEVDVLHRDAVAGIAAYGRRHEWGARAFAPFLRRYPDRPESAARLRTELPPGQARGPSEVCWVAARLALSNTWGLGFIRSLIEVIERGGGGDRVLFPLYRVLLGLHLFRGFRQGLASVRTAPPVPPRLSTATQDAPRTG